MNRGVSDDAWRAAGARLAADCAAVWAEAELIVKVRAPQPSEFGLLRAGSMLFTGLQLAPDPVQAHALLASGCTAIAYETVTGPGWGLPQRAPMSEVDGRMAMLAGAHWLERTQGGSGALMRGLPGVAPGDVVGLGGGVFGYNAARVASGIGARMTVRGRSPGRARFVRRRPASRGVSPAAAARAGWRRAPLASGCARRARAARRSRAP
jgi:alanine dehydrogenase